MVRQAAEWLAHVESDDACQADHEQLAAWRTADPAHAVALDRLAGLQDNLDGASGVTQETLRRLLLRPRRRMGASVLVLMALISAGWLASSLSIVQLYFADQQTSVGETRVIALSDGSSLTLSTGSAVNIDVGNGKRTVHLLRGELLVHVAKGRSSKFEVTFEDGNAVALGTAYTVHKEADSTIVAVAESHVRVCPALGDDAECLTLSAGQRGRLTRKSVERMADMPPANVGAWADGWLSVDDQPVTEVLNEFNLWRKKPFVFDPVALAGLRVSGAFPLGDTDKAAANLTKLLPIVIDHRDPDALVIRHR